MLYFVLLILLVGFIYTSENMSYCESYLSVRMSVL